MIIDPKFAQFVAELGEVYDATLAKYDDNLVGHYPFTLEVRTVDGLAARYMEEGIDFYPDSNN